MFTLETERLLLRKLADGDLDELVALDADPEVMRYINDGAATPRAEYESEALELGYRLCRAAWGRGLAPDAVVRGAIARSTSRVRSQGSKPCCP